MKENKTERSLADVMGAQYGHNSSKTTEVRTKTLSTSDEAVDPNFLAELEGNDAEIDDIKSLDDLLIHPQPGSIIMAFKDPQRRSKAHMLKFATESFLPNIAPILFSDDIPMEMYVIFRIVLPHKRALAVAEKIGKISRESGVKPVEILSQISGLDIKDRSDVKKVLLKALNYHPHIGQVLSSFLSKVTVKS